MKVSLSEAHSKATGRKNRRKAMKKEKSRLENNSIKQKRSISA